MQRHDPRRRTRGTGQVALTKPRRPVHSNDIPDDVPPRATPHPYDVRTPLRGRQSKAHGAPTATRRQRHVAPSHQPTRLSPPRHRRRDPHPRQRSTRRHTGARAEHQGATTLPHDTPAQRHWGAEQSTIAPNFLPGLNVEVRPGVDHHQDLSAHHADGPPSLLVRVRTFSCGGHGSSKT